MFYFWMENKRKKRVLNATYEKLISFVFLARRYTISNGSIFVSQITLNYTETSFSRSYQWKTFVRESQFHHQKSIVMFHWDWLPKLIQFSSSHIDAIKIHFSGSIEFKSNVKFNSELVLYLATSCQQIDIYLNATNQEINWINIHTKIIHWNGE